MQYLCELLLIYRRPHFILYDRLPIDLSLHPIEVAFKTDYSLHLCVFNRVYPHLKRLQLMLPEHIYEWLRSVPIYGPCLCDIVCHLWQVSLIQLNQ